MTFGVFIQQGKGLPTLVCWRDNLLDAQVIISRIEKQKLEAKIFQIEWPDNGSKRDAASNACGSV